jgi:hypothetical protein
MLISIVILPEAFSVEHFSKPQYQDNMQILLEGIQTNGLILVDKEDRLFKELCDKVLSLAENGKYQKIVIHFEELVKKQRARKIRFVKTNISSKPALQLSEVAARIAIDCKGCSLLTDPNTTYHSTVIQTTGGKVPVIPILNYIPSNIEAERKKYLNGLPSLDMMEIGQFDKLIIDATRFSRSLKFYDKQIGKGTNLSRFRLGIKKILQLWVKNAYFPKNELSVILYTVVDESINRRTDAAEAYNKVKANLVDSLAEEFGLRFEFIMKHDPESHCHARHLQTQTFAIMFEKGFDFLENDGKLSRTFITIGGDFSDHLNEFQKLKPYIPPRP